jgi:predicted RNase H-like HicB family nuclease
MLKIDITEYKDTLMRKHSGYVAALGPWKEYGKTKTEAKNNLQEALNWFMEITQSDLPLVVHACDSIFVLSYTFYGLEIKRIDANNKDCGVEFMGRITLQEAIARFQNIVDQYIDAVNYIQG